MLVDVNFAERLREALRVSGKKRKQLAEHLGVTQSTITQAVNGQTAALSAANSARAAEFCRVEALWLATGEGPMRQAALSPMALDLARRFDRARVEERDRLYALVLYQLQLASVPQLPAPTQSPAPTDEPDQHR